MDTLKTIEKESLKIDIELLTKLNSMDLMDLCDATEATMLETYAFGIGHRQWHPPIRDHIESYFKGVALVPERKLIVGRIDNTISGTIQVITPHISNQTSNFIVSLDNHFVAPWARNLGLGRKILEFAESYSKKEGYEIIKLSVRSIREEAIALYESSGYKKWGTMEKYERIGNKYISGQFYSKEL